MANINEIRPFSGDSESPWKPRGPVMNRARIEATVGPEGLAKILADQAQHDRRLTPITRQIPRKSLYQP